MTNDNNVNVTLSAREPMNGLAVAGLVCGLIGASFAWIPILGTGAWFWLLPGALMSLSSLFKDTGRPTAIAACIANGVGLAFCFWYVAAIGSVFQAASAPTQPIVADTPAPAPMVWNLESTVAAEPERTTIEAAPPDLIVQDNELSSCGAIGGMLSNGMCWSTVKGNPSGKPGASCNPGGRPISLGFDSTGHFLSGFLETSKTFYPGCWT